MKSLVSIITPTYNQAHFLKECIDSVIQQTYTNWELIIIDDHSTDDTEEVVKPYLKDTRIIYVKNTKRLGIKGLANTYNKALKESNGEYIAILEGDDYWPQDKLENQVADLVQSNAIVSFANWIMVDTDKYYLKYGTYNLENGIIPQQKMLDLIVDLSFYLIPSSVLVNRDALKKIGGFQKSNYYPFIDIPTFSELVLCGNFIYTNTIGAFYRKHDGSTWFEYASKSTYMIKEEVSLFTLDFIKKNKKFFQDSSKKAIENEQNLYLRKKSYLFLKTLLFHKLAFSSNKIFIVKMCKISLHFLIVLRIRFDKRK